MEFLKRNLTQIQAQLGGMSFATRWLIGSLIVIMLLVGSMLVLWGGSADMVPVDGIATGSAGEVVTALQADGIEARVRNGQVVVPIDQRHEAVGSLSRSGHLDPNAHAAFDKLLSSDDGGSMFLTSTEKDRKYLAAKGQFLSAVIQSFPNVDSAAVLLDKPEANGFGVSHIDPSASVMVSMRAGAKVNRQMADTLIHMVSSSVAGLDERQVTVSDTLHSRSFTAADPEDVGALASVEATLTNERLHKQRIESVLRTWEGAMVAVKIVASQVLREEVRETTYQEKDQLVSTETEELESENFANGGAPGIRANTGSTIEGSGGTGTRTTENRSFNQFGTKQPTMQATRKIAGNTIRKINVSVVIPRSYYVRVYRAKNPEGEAPSDEDLVTIIQDEESKIKELITPQIVSNGETDEEIKPGEISVAMVYDQAYLEPVAAGVSSGLGAVMSSDTTQTGMLAGLAVLAMGLMVYMVRRATRPEDLPTVEELAGVPPTLPTDDDLMGEVDMMDGGLAGVELDEEELRARQIAEQISDLVRANPEEAGGLLTKWVVDDRG